MDVINIHDAKTQLSKLVELAATVREFIIAKAGKPMVRVVPYHIEALHHLGGLKGQAVLDLDLKADFSDEI